MVPAGQPPQFVKVIKTEEKGSDVNLATHLLHDAHTAKFDIGVVISNDSDLLEPIKLVRHHLKKQVGVLNPHNIPAALFFPTSISSNKFAKAFCRPRNFR